MLCFHFKMTPTQVDELTTVQFNMLLRTLNDHFKRKVGE